MDKIIDNIADAIAERVAQKLGYGGIKAHPADEPKKLLSKEAVCEELGVSASTINRWIKQGLLEPTYVGRKVLVSRNALNEFIRNSNDY